MNLDFYYAPTSSPCRAVMLTAEAIGVTLNLKSIDVMAGEHLNSKYEQINPQKTVPCLVDGDLTLTESRAIMAYLVDQYGKNTRLYPKMVNSRALVNQRLYFDIGTFHKAMAACYYPILFGKWKTYQSEHYDNLKKAFEILDKFLEGQDYVAGRSLTIADLSLVASVTTAEAFGFDFAKFRNVTRWLKKVKTFAPGYRKANGEGAESMKKLIERVMTQIDEL
nr:glutathione-S-transferase 3 [Cephus cinctus]